MKEAVKKLVLNAQFKVAETKLLLINESDEQFVFDKTWGEPTNICPYIFACYLIQQGKALKYHGVAYGTIILDLSFLKGGRATAFYHLSRSIALEPWNVDLYETQLASYGIPDFVLSDEEARRIAEIALRRKPDSTWAKKVLEELQRPTRLKAPVDPVLEPLKYLFLTGKLIKAKKMLSTTPKEEVYELLRSIANNEKSLCAYIFVWYLMEDGETSELHLLAAEIARKVFDHRPCCLPEGIEQAVFFHIHRASELAPDDISLQEKLLAFYEVTPESFGCGEVEKIAQNVLDHNPSSEIAQKFYPK